MLNQFFRALGFGLCHQLPERSFFGGGVQLPVCARDTGIYVGFVVAAIAIIVLHHPRRPARFTDAYGWVVLGLLFGSMVFDGVTSYAGIRESNNVLRLLTGISGGFAIAAVAIPLLDDELWQVPDQVRVLTPLWRLVAWVLLAPITGAVLWWGAPLLGVVYPFLVAASILVTFTVVNMVFAALLPAFDRTAKRWTDLGGPVAIGLTLTVVEIFGAAMLRSALDALARRFA